MVSPITEGDPLVSGEQTDAPDTGKEFPKQVTLGWGVGRGERKSKTESGSQLVLGTSHREIIEGEKHYASTSNCLWIITSFEQKFSMFSNQIQH